jgi:KipI family sensor histidine kinase inhibitor
VARDWRWVGERALLRTFPGDLPAANAAAFAAYRRIAASEHPEIEDVVPGARTLLVVLRPGEEPGEELLAEIELPASASPRRPDAIREIPVSYGGDDGPDLGDVASLHGLSAADVVRMHSSASYVVGFTGFSPGFPYLFGLPEALATPRLATPRTRIAKGGVGIGGSYTGVYPQATAGGWRIIGRTDLELFDPTREPPVLLAPGTGVRFIPA